MRARIIRSARFQRPTRIVCGALCAGLVVATPAWADAPDPTEEEVPPGRQTTSGDVFGGPAPEGTFSWRTLTQVRYRGTRPDPGELDVDPSVATEQRGTIEDGDGYRLQRMFLRLSAKPNKHLEFKMIVDFAEFFLQNTRRAIKQAFVDFKPWSRVKISAGLFKRPFSLLELLPIADYELADLGSADDFLQEQGFAGRDVGVMIEATPLPRKRWLRASLAAFGGDTEVGYDAHPTKLLLGRLESEPVKNHLRIGLDMAWRTDSSIEWLRRGSVYSTRELAPGRAYSADVTGWFGPVELRTEAMMGDRVDPWRNGPDRFWAAWGLVTVKLQVRDISLLPVLRAEWLDASRNGRDGRLTVAAGLNVDFTPKIRLLIDVSRYDVQHNSLALKNVPWMSGAREMRVQDVDSTTIVVQVQARI